MADDVSPFRVVQTEGGRRFAFDVVADKLARQQKRATFGRFEILCDESARLGGDDSAPPPLAYFSAALAF
jgi:uncharacterized OsmC-like protein